MKNILHQALEAIGPTGSSGLAAYLRDNHQMSPEAARKCISRHVEPVMAFPIPLLPKKEKFLYLREQRGNDDFWPKFLIELRKSNSAVGIAIDGIIARGGIVSIDEFQTVSGAPKALKKQLTHDIIVNRLESAHIIVRDGDYYKICNDHIFQPVTEYEYRQRDLVEKILLDGMRAWARNLGLASYDSIAIRGDERSRLVGQFQWDMTGPSYIWPLRKPIHKAFLVADAFCGDLDSNFIKFFIHKLQMLQNTVREIQLLPIIVASKFDENAFSCGKNLGIILATHQSLFGVNVANAIKNLLVTLGDVARGFKINPDNIDRLLNNLSVIEGSAGNLRGILFELIVYYLASIGAMRIEFSKKAIDPDSGEQADIDVLKVENKSKCTCIECKGIAPGGSVNINDVKHWIDKISVMKKWLRSNDSYKDSDYYFEIWTTGTFTSDTIAYLEDKKKQMKKTSISWKNGDDIYSMSHELKETAISNTLNQHFRKHPYAKL